MEKRKNIDLRKAIPDTPDMCREAVLHAVSTYQEERIMRRSYKSLLVAAALAILLCGTAYAIINYYSVRDYVAKGNTSTAFNENVIPLEQTATSGDLSILLGDAVFDGQNLAFTMHVNASEGANPVYILPELTAWHGEEELNVEYMGTHTAMDLGFFAPSADERYPLPEHWGVDALLEDVPGVDSVKWRYTLKMFTPNAPLVEAPAWWFDEGVDEAWEQSIRDIHNDGKIAVANGTGIYDYLAAINPTYTGGLSFEQRLLDSGRFMLSDTIVFEFETPVTKKQQVSPDTTFEFDGYTVTVKNITQTFLQVQYELEVVYEEPQPNEHFLEQFYTLIDQNGNEMGWNESSMTLHDDKVTCTVVGSVERISDDPLTEITFRLDHTLTIDQTDTAEDMPSFTISLVE